MAKINFYSFYANDWNKTEKPKAHIKSFMPLPNIEAAIEYAKELIHKWKVESVRILNGATGEDIIVRDNMENIEYEFSITSTKKNDRILTTE